MDKFWENYIKTRPADSKGAFEEFKQMHQEPRITGQEPRIELSGGGAPIDPLDPQFKLADAIKAYQDYYSGPGKKKRKLPFKTFFRIYAKENFADGGSAGQLVTPSVDGSRPGYAGDRDRSTKIKNFIGKKKKIKKTEIIKLLNDLKYPNWSTQLAKLKERGYFDNVEIIDDYKRTADTLEGGGSRISQVEDVFKNWKSTGKTNYTKQELIEALPEGVYEKNKAAYDTAEHKIRKKYKSIKLLEQNIDRSKPLPKSVQQKLVEAFPEIDFKFGTKAQPGYGIRKYGVSKKDIGEALYSEIQAFAKYNLEPQFPKGTTPESKLLHQMFRSTQPGSGGGVRFQLVDKNGKVIPKEKYPKNWRKDGAYKNIRVLDTETGDIIKYTDDIKGKGISMKEYINKVEKNPQAYNQALESYKLQKNISTTPYMYKGKEYTLGGTLNKNRVIQNFKKEFKRMPNKKEMKDLFRSTNVGSWQVHHPEGVANNWWKSEVAFRDANMKLNYLDRNLKASLKTIKNPGDKAKLIKQVSREVKKLPGGISYIFEGQELGKPFNLKSVIRAPLSQASLKSGEKKAIEKVLSNFWCGKKQSVAGGGRIGFSGSCPIEVKQKNFIAFNNDVRTGRITGEAAEQIAKNTAKVVTKAGSKSALASLLGPAGIGLDVIYEVASVGTDIYGGKPWREAVQDNWIAGAFMPGTSQEEFHKAFFKKHPEAKTYGSGLDLEQAFLKKQKQIERLKASDTYWGKAEASQQLPQLERDLEGIAAQYNALGDATEEGSPEYEAYMAAKTEYLDARKATSPATAAKLKMELDPIESDRFKSYEESSPVKMDFSLPGNYTTFKPDLPPQLGGTLSTKKEIDRYYRGLDMELSSQDIDFVQKLEKWNQLFYDPENRGMGIRGTQDWRGAGGGMVGIRKPSAIPPESGPQSQGLASLKKYGSYY
jgi:hypothetical protein